MWVPSCCAIEFAGDDDKDDVVCSLLQAMYNSGGDVHRNTEFIEPLYVGVRCAN
jgi:hypothetical protein